jgi:hypothetical protein
MVHVFLTSGIVLSLSHASWHPRAKLARLKLQILHPLSLQWSIVEGDKVYQFTSDSIITTRPPRPSSLVAAMYLVGIFVAARVSDVIAFAHCCCCCWFFFLFLLVLRGRDEGREKRHFEGQFLPTV